MSVTLNDTEDANLWLKSPIIYCVFLRKKSLGPVLFSRDVNIHFFGLRHISSKFIINLKWRKCKNCKDINKEKYKNTKFDKFLNYYTHNKNEIKESAKLRIKTEGTSWNWNMKYNVMAR